MNNFDFFIADCSPEGGIYRYRKTDGDIKKIDFLPLFMPMYMARENEKLYVLLRKLSDDETDSAIVSYDILCDAFSNPSEPQSTRGECGCHLWVDNGVIYAVNYLSGSVIKLPDKSMTLSGNGPHPTRQTMPHTHYVTKTSDGYILVTDLGTDSVITFTEDLEEVCRSNVPAGHGSRHLIISHDSKYVYCVNELTATVSVFSYKEGRLSLSGTYNSLPDDFTSANTAAAIRLSEDGKYLYVSNRGHDSISAFEIQGDELILRSITPCHGKGPRDFNIIGNQIICTNEDSGNVTIFDVDGEKLIFKQELTGFIRPLCVI